MPITRLPGQVIRSGSVPTTALGGGVVSSSVQINTLLPGGTVSSSGQVNYTGLSSIPSGIVSGAAQVKSLLPAGTISSSVQLPAGTVSSSGQVSYTGLSNIPAGIVSSSTQINNLSNVSASFATTASFASNGGVTVSSTSTNATFYPLLFNATSGTTSTASVDTGWTFNPSTNAMVLPGTLTLNSALSVNNSITIDGVGSQFNCLDKLVTQPCLTDYTERYNTATISGGTLTLDISLGNVFRTTRNANISTLTISNPGPTNNACSFTLIFDANGSSYTITWPSSIKWPGGTAPTITTTNGRSDMFVFYTNNAGTTWYAMTAAQNFVTT